MRRMTNARPTIAVLIHDYLIREGVTENEFARLLGADQAQVSRWRRGTGVPRATWNDELAAVLGLAAEDIERARLESSKVRGAVSKSSPADELRDLKSELRQARARIARLEAKLKKSGGNPG